MLKELKFVQGAVAKKDFVPALTHFKIENGRVQGFNGTLALSSPIPFDIACKPRAEPLVKAIGNCSDAVSLTLTPTGKLSIRSGKFKALIDCVEGEVPQVQPDGDHIEVHGESMLAAIKAVAPFIGDDASRPWTNGVLFKGSSAFATNNVMVVEYWTGVPFPAPVNIPRSAIKEILRLDEPPVAVQATASAVTFHFSEERWLRTQLYPSDWPDLARILDKPANAIPLDKKLPEALEVIKPFLDKSGRVLFREGKVCTHNNDNEGASYELDDFNWPGVYRLDMLSTLCTTAKSIDWTLYPSPCLFFGDNIRGAIVGMRE